MTELLSADELRQALQDAMIGRQAKDAPFSRAWAEGKLRRHHFARWAENHYHYVGPFADYLAYIYESIPEQYTDAKDFMLQNMYEEELADIRHTDLLIKTVRVSGASPVGGCPAGRPGRRAGRGAVRDAWTGVDRPAGAPRAYRARLQARHPVARPPPRATIATSPATTGQTTAGPASAARAYRGRSAL